MIRPRLYGDDNAWLRIINKIRNIGLEKADYVLHNNVGYKFDSNDNSVTSQKGYRIKTPEDLIKVANIDLNVWNIERKEVNSWEQHSVKEGYKTLHQVKIWLKRKHIAKPKRDWVEDWLRRFETKVPKVQRPKVTSTERPLVVTVTDLHIGHYMSKDRLIPDYNQEICREKLSAIAEIANSYNRPVHLVLLGDIIESFTGRNHPDTWKQIELHGAKAVLTAYDILYQFINKCTNLQKIYMVSGNHDRVTTDRSEDYEGQVAELLYGMLKRYTHLDIEYDPLILTPTIDGIKYLLSHGDFLYKSKKYGDVILDYGDKDLYNLILIGHYHQANILEDRLKYRVVVSPSIITGTNYEKRNNWNAPSGFVISENSGNGIPRMSFETI